MPHRFGNESRPMQGVSQNDPKPAGAADCTTDLLHGLAFRNKGPEYKHAIMIS